ncbi:MAG: hypothetical protein J1F39_01795 [Clostridiales bacterium]|nr:hypothetical protein [Clostridiales bacterium]
MREIAGKNRIEKNEVKQIAGLVNKLDFLCSNSRDSYSATKNESRKGYNKIGTKNYPKIRAA